MATLQLTTTTTPTRKGAVSLGFKATGAGITSKVFAIEVLPKSADATQPNYRFSHVCSVAELTEFPADVPGDCSYFRTDDIELVFDTMQLVPSVTDNMKEDVAELVNQWNALESAVPGIDSLYMTSSRTRTAATLTADHSKIYTWNIAVNTAASLVKGTFPSGQRAVSLVDINMGAGATLSCTGITKSATLTTGLNKCIIDWNGSEATLYKYS